MSVPATKKVRPGGRRGRGSNNAQQMATKDAARELTAVREALDLRRRGMTYAAIGAAQGITAGGARKRVAVAYEQGWAEIADDAAALLIEHHDRLMVMLSQLWPTATRAGMAQELVEIVEGAPNVKRLVEMVEQSMANWMAAVDRVQRLIDQDAKLMGLYAKKAGDDQGDEDDEIEKLTPEARQRRFAQAVARLDELAARRSAKTATGG